MLKRPLSVESMLIKKYGNGHEGESLSSSITTRFKSQKNSTVLFLRFCATVTFGFGSRDFSKWETCIQALLLAIICPAEVSLRTAVNRCQLLCIQSFSMMLYCFQLRNKVADFRPFASVAPSKKKPQDGWWYARIKGILLYICIYVYICIYMRDKIDLSWLLTVHIKAPGHPSRTRTDSPHVPLRYLPVFYEQLPFISCNSRYNYVQHN